MPISVVCQACGKQLKVKDEWAGKRAKCPGCGATFLVGAAGQAPTFAARGGQTAFNPQAAAATRSKRDTANGSLSISPGLIATGIAGVVLIILITLFLMGPKRAWSDWAALGDKPQDDVTNVVSRGLECYMQSLGLYNPRKSRGRPECKAVTLYPPTLAMRMPDDVPFLGNTSIGPLDGTYHPRTGEVDATVWEGGMQPIPGSGGKFTKGTPVKITGREKAGVLTTEINGKPMKLIMPPVSPDDDK